jgi:hypothetical protein
MLELAAAAAETMELHKVVNRYGLMVDWWWVHWGYFTIAAACSLWLGLGAFKIHGERAPPERGMRRWWQKWFNTAGWVAGWTVLVRWLGCSGFVCTGEPTAWTILLAVVAFAGIVGQLPWALMNGITALALYINRLASSESRQAVRERESSTTANKGEVG